MTALALSEGGGNIIQPDGSLIFVLVLFLIFVFVLNRVLFRPISRVLDERETLTEGARSEARAAVRSYQTQLADYEARIRNARGEGYRRLEAQRAAALEGRRQLIEQAKAETNSQIEQAKTDIAREAAQARTALETEARQIANQISRAVLGRTVGGGAD